MTAACPACASIPEPNAAPALAKPDVILSVPSMHCAACMGAVERTLTSLDGVANARVNLTLKRVNIETVVAPDRLIAALSEAGFPAYEIGSALAEPAAGGVSDLAMRLGVAGFAMMNVMLLSVAVWSGAADATRDLFHLISAAISLPAVAFSAQPFFQSALRALRASRLNMDVPISLAIILAAGMSLYEALNGGHHAYFDAALSLTFFLLIGRFLDHRTKIAARSAAKELSLLEEHTALIHGANGITSVQVDQVALGDRVRVLTGARVPVDGRLVDAEATTDRSVLTGESDAINQSQDDHLSAGEVNLGAPFDVIATAVGQDTTLRRMATLVEQAENARNRYTTLADKAARLYAPTVHILAAVAFVVWWAVSGDLRYALNIAIAVLIITCPCALGLAVPAVSTAAIGKLYELGFLVTSGSALERIAETERVVFDKTGTLTVPEFDVDLSALGPDDQSILLALALQSGHPVSQAIVTALSDLTAGIIDDVIEHPGKGVAAIWQGAQVRLGRMDWLGGEGRGLGVMIGDRRIPLRRSERLRDGAVDAVASLAKQGLDVTLLSGDEADKVQEVADTLSINDVHAQLSPQDKHRYVSQSPKKVWMIGDGLNDTAALAAAHASLAPSSALDASRNAADVLVLRDDFSNVAKVHDIAKKFTHLCRQNFAIAGAYNMIAIPVALLGYATPMLAAFAMSASSLTVLLNALRVRRVS